MLSASLRLTLRARFAHAKLLQAHVEPKGGSHPTLSACPISTVVQHHPSLFYFSVSYLLLCTTSSRIIQANLLIFIGRFVGRRYHSMKRKGKHPEKALSALGVCNISTPGFYADGNGLYLKVDKSGSKRRIQRIMINRKRVDLGLGSLRDVSLKEARE